MAIVRVGGGITDIKGSIGGTTYQRSRSGVIAKSRTGLVNKDTPFQGIAKGNLSFMAKAWSVELTDAERIQWNQFALSNPTVNAFGDTTYLSGSQWFNKLNTVLRNLGVALVTTPPASLFVTSLTDVVYTAGTGATPTITVEPDPSSLAADEEIYIWVSYPASPGIFFANSKLKFITTGTGASISIGTNVVAKFGTWPSAVGLKTFCWAAVVNTANGVVSPGILTSVLTA